MRAVLNRISHTDRNRALPLFPPRNAGGKGAGAPANYFWTHLLPAHTSHPLNRCANHSFNPSIKIRKLTHPALDGAPKINA